MVDFHIHILPGVDDGSKNSEMSISMLHMEYEQGVETIVATPHFYAHHASVNHFLEKRQKAYDRLQNAIAETGGSPVSQMKIIPGAEVYYFSGMGSAAEIPKLCVADTHTILVEMPFEQWTDAVYRDLKALIEKQHLNVVLVHIERYPEFQKSMSTWDRIFGELPVTAQINTGSFLKKGGLFTRDKKRKFALNWMEAHPGTILGSDAHNITSRCPNIGAGRAVIEKQAGAEILRAADEAAEKLLTPANRI